MELSLSLKGILAQIYDHLKSGAPTGPDFKLAALRPFGLLDFVLHALQALRPCDPHNDALDSDQSLVLVDLVHLLVVVVVVVVVVLVLLLVLLAVIVVVVVVILLLLVVVFVLLLLLPSSPLSSGAHISVR